MHGKLSKPTRVGIGMPVLNGERYIAESLNSLLSQSYSNFCLLISDNCSTDMTGEICKSYARGDRRICYHRHSQQKTALENFSYVAENVQTEYFMWAAADDIWKPRFLATMVELLDSRADSVGAFCKYGVIGVNSNELNHIESQIVNIDPVLSGTYRRNSLTSFFLSDLGTNPLCIYYSLFRRAALLESIIANPTQDFGYGDELIGIARILVNGNIAISDNVLWIRREHDDNFGPKRHVVSPIAKFFGFQLPGFMQTFYLYMRIPCSLWRVIMSNGRGSALKRIQMASILSLQLSIKQLGMYLKILARTSLKYYILHSRQICNNVRDCIAPWSSPAEH